MRAAIFCAWSYFLFYFFAGEKNWCFWSDLIELQVDNSWTTVGLVLKWSSAGDYRMHCRSPEDLGSFPSGTTVYKYVVFYMHLNTHVLAVQIPALPSREMTSRKSRLVALPLWHFITIFTTACVLLILLANTQCKHATIY